MSQVFPCAAGPGRVRLGCAGAVVLDDIASLPELSHPPWTDERLVGVIDFPHLEVAPGSRRGIVPDAAAAALVDALLGIEALVLERLDHRSRAEAASLSVDMHRQLARLFTRVTDFVPHLQWFPVAKRSGTIDEVSPTGSGVAATPIPRDVDEEPAAQPELFPPGPLFAVTVRPSRLELAVHDRKELIATATDEHGRAIREGVTFEWTASSALSLSAAGNLATVEALSATAEARPRLRYLAMLLSKEVVSRNFPQPGVGATLEEFVGLLAALERSGAWRGRARDDE